MRQTVVFAETEPWESFGLLAGALRRNGFTTIRLTTPLSDRTRKQRLADLAYRVPYTATETALVWEGDQTAVDISAAKSPWLSHVVDVQAADRVGAALAATQRWADSGLMRTPDLRTEQRIYDKGAQMVDAAAAGVAVPRTSANPADIDGAQLVAKLPLGSGGDAVRLIKRADTAVVAKDWGTTTLFQEVLTGTQLTVGGIAVAGELICAVAYETEPPPGNPTGPSAFVRFLDRPDLLAACADYLKYVNYSGAFCVDFLGDQFIDFNPRFFHSWAAAQVAGVPILQSYLDLIRHSQQTKRGSQVSYGQELLTTPVRLATRGETVKETATVLGQLSPIVGKRGLVSLAPAALTAVL